VGEPVSGQRDEHVHMTGDTAENWIKPVGDVAAPLLAGFSFTSVIVLSDDAGAFKWPGEAILALTIAAIALIAAVQCAKYARPDRWSGANRSKAAAKFMGNFPYFSVPIDERAKVWSKWTRRYYHLGISALLLGLAFALAPQHVTGVQGILRWTASVLAFVACALETLVFLTVGREPADGEVQGISP
jgi:hypothetical protein